jgi:hypothetical protein
MYIEDLLQPLMYAVKTNRYDSTLVQSFYEQINYKSLGFTEKQATIMLKISKAYKQQINAHLNKDISPLLDNPRYKYNIRTISLVKHISVIANSNKSKSILVKFPYDEKLVTEIKTNKQKFIASEWNPTEKAWVFSLEGASIEYFSGYVMSKGFTADDEFKDYMEQALEITNNVEKYAPMLTIEQEIPKIVNIPAHVPQPTNTDLLQALFESRRVGVTTWDQSVDEALSTYDILDITKDFIKSTPNENFSINLEKNSILDLKPIVKNLLPCIVTVPGGNEFNKMQQALELLKDIGIENHEISVLFRLPNDTGGDFNKFVKEEKLNSPLSENTKAVILSGKLPKPLFESELKFNCVLNFNFYNVHYTLANFMKNKHNVINVVSDKTSKSLQIEYV